MQNEKKQLQEMLKTPAMVDLAKKEGIPVRTLYPKTASEYAEQLNSLVKPGTWGGKLATDPMHWAEYGVYTGEELAHYLLRAQHNDLYKSIYGIRPRGFDYKDISIEDLEAEIEELLTMPKHQYESANKLDGLKKIIKEEVAGMIKEVGERDPVRSAAHHRARQKNAEIEKALIELNKASMKNRIPPEAAEHPQFAYTLGYQRALKDVAEKLLGIIF